MSKSAVKNINELTIEVEKLRQFRNNNNTVIKMSYGT